MKLIQEIKKGIWTKYQLDTLWTVDNIALYLDHAPQSVNYPIIKVSHISSNQTMAMLSDTNPVGWDYSDGRWQFSIFGNDRQHSDLEDITDRLEDLYHRKSLPTGNGVTHIATISYNNNTTFFDEGVKVWGIHLDMRIIVGR
jgi:hypothetical protein